MTPKKKKPMEEMTSEEVMQKIFGKKVVRELKKVVEKTDRKATEKYEKKKRKNHTP